MMRFLLLVILSMAAVVSAQDDVTTPPGQVPLDDVWCTVCHFEQGDKFALSVHYQRGMLLCTDCHGGDPFEPETEKAKAAETGFIGKPARADIVAVCSQCHTGPAEFFALGPHTDATDPDNPTCVTCHQNHLVVDATLTLMDTTCAVCHGDDKAIGQRVQRIQRSLRDAEQSLHSVRARFDSLQQFDAALGRSAGVLMGAAAVLRQVDARTHALDEELIDTAIADFEVEVEAVDKLLNASEQSRRRRHWAVAGVWLFVVANVTLMWVKRRQM